MLYCFQFVLAPLPLVCPEQEPRTTHSCTLTSSFEESLKNVAILIVEQYLVLIVVINSGLSVYGAG